MTEDFEFKPLTEGLGFHKKVIELKEEAAPAAATRTIHPTLPTKQATTPLTSPTIHPQAPAPQPIPETKPQWKPALPKAEFKERAAVPTKLVPASHAWPSAIFDMTMITGMTLIFSAVVFAITKIDLGTLSDMLSSDRAAQVALLVLVLSVFEIYTVACRSFFGKTLGEWAFDFRLGTIEQQSEMTYPLKVALRSMLIAITGFIVLPLISTFMKKDISGLLSGVSLFEEKL